MTDISIPRSSKPSKGNTFFVTNPLIYSIIAALLLTIISGSNDGSIESFNNSKNIYPASKNSNANQKNYITNPNIYENTGFPQIKNQTKDKNQTKTLIHIKEIIKNNKNTKPNNEEIIQSENKIMPNNKEIQNFEILTEEITEEITIEEILNTDSTKVINNTGKIKTPVCTIGKITDTKNKINNNEDGAIKMAQSLYNIKSNIKEIIKQDNNNLESENKVSRPKEFKSKSKTKTSILKIDNNKPMKYMLDNAIEALEKNTKESDTERFYEEEVENLKNILIKARKLLEERNEEITKNENSDEIKKKKLELREIDDEYKVLSEKQNKIIIYVGRLHDAIKKRHERAYKNAKIKVDTITYKMKNDFSEQIKNYFIELYNKYDKKILVKKLKKEIVYIKQKKGFVINFIKNIIGSNVDLSYNNRLLNEAKAELDTASKTCKIRRDILIFHSNNVRNCNGCSISISELDKLVQSVHNIKVNMEIDIKVLNLTLSLKDIDEYEFPMLQKQKNLVENDLRSVIDRTGVMNAFKLVKDLEEYLTFLRVDY